MQKQKIIAKWLAVVLLLTVAIACYVGLSSIIKKDGDNVAGANGTEQNQGEITVSKTFSVLPRACENVDGIKVNHVGGSGNEKVLKTLFCFSKTLVIFCTDSEDRDVKEKGIYIAAFCDDTLEKVVKIASDNESFLDCSQSRNGLVFFILSPSGTRVVTLDESLSVKARCTTKKYTILKTYLHANELNAIAYDGNEMTNVFVGDNLEISTDNFVLSQTDIVDIKVIAYCENVMIFANTADTAFCATYNRNTGFRQSFTQDKSTIVQIVPVVASNRQTFVALVKTIDDFDVVSLNASLDLIKKERIEQSKSASLFALGNSVAVLTENGIYRFCAHLDFGGKSSLSSVGISEDILTLQAVDGKNTAIIHQKDKSILLEYKDSTFSQIATLPPVRNLFLSTISAGKNTRYTLAFESDSHSKTTYMGFGGIDVFTASLLTTEQG